MATNTYTYEQCARYAAATIGSAMYRKYGAFDFDGTRNNVGGQAIPHEAVEPITEVILIFISNLLQQWLNAGSEAEVTYEELEQPVQNHVRGWTVDEVEGG